MDDDNFPLILPKSAILTKEDVHHLTALCKLRSLQYEANLLNPELAEKNERWMRQHPRLSRAIQASSKFWLSRSQDSTLKTQDSDVIDIEKLEEMNLSDEKLKEIAGIKDKKE